MLNLIAMIDIAWHHKEVLYDIDPNKCHSYFAFRNQVIRLKQSEVA